MSIHDPLSARQSITLFPGEKAEELAHIEETLLKECDPQNYSERVIVYEFAAAVWEVLRYKRIRDHLIMLTRNDVIRERLTGLLQNDPEAYDKIDKNAWQSDAYSFDAPQELTERFVRGDTQAQELIHYFLKKYKISMEEIVAEATAKRLGQITIIEKTIAEIVRRRDKIILELDRRKERREQLRALADDLARAKT